jgi:phage terminase large subunit
LNRASLELKAAAILESKRRKALAASKEKTVYGIVCPDHGLLRCWQEHNGAYVEVDKEPTLSVPAKLEPAIIIPKPIKVIDGGRGSGKSENVSAILTARVKDYGRKLGCFREFQNSISDSVHSIISKKIRSLGFHGFDVQESKISHDNGGSVKYRGLARNPEGVKSMDGFTDFWIEEAQTISSRSLELIEPTLREDGSEIWYTLNRGSSADPISQEHLNPYKKALDRYGYYEDDDIMVIILNYDDNPWFPENLENKRRKNKKTWSTAKYDHVWNGAFNDEVEDSIIKAEWFDACVNAHKIEELKRRFRPLGARIAAHDPSDTGNDDKGYALRHGSVIKRVSVMNTGEVDDGCDWATGEAIKDSADWFVWDGDGMGTGLKRQVSTAFAGTNTKYHMFRGSLSGVGQDNGKKIYMPQEGDEDTKPKTYAETFKNNRAQYYIDLARRCHNTYRCVVKGDYVDPDDMISFDSDGVEDMQGLRSEMCRIPRKPNANGLEQIMNKDEMKKLGIESPNMADPVMMCLFTPIKQTAFEPLDYPEMSIV